MSCSKIRDKKLGVAMQSLIFRKHFFKTPYQYCGKQVVGVKHVNCQLFDCFLDNFGLQPQCGKDIKGEQWRSSQSTISEGRCDPNPWPGKM